MDRSKTKSAPFLRRVVPHGLCLLALFSFASCRPFFKREVSSAVLAVEGPTEKTLAGRTSRLTTNEWILPGAKVTTAPRSRVDLMLLPGILVQLEGDTEIEITRLRFARNGDETLHPMKAREASIRLLRGTLFVVIGQSQMRSRIFVQTPAGDLTAFDLRTFKIAVDGNRTRAMSVRGKISFKPANGGAPMNLSAGYFSEWPSNETESRPASQSDAATQAEVPQILKVGKRLVRLQNDCGFGFAPWKQ